MIEFWIDFLAILDLFWEPSWAMLAPKTAQEAPKSAQESPKTTPKSLSRRPHDRSRVLKALKIDFWSIFGPQADEVPPLPKFDRKSIPKIRFLAWISLGKRPEIIQTYIKRCQPIYKGQKPPTSKDKKVNC